MDYLSIFQRILSTEGPFLDIYLDGLDEHNQFGIQNNNETELVQHITSLLTSSTTRILGLRLLAKFIDNCSLNALENKGNLWTTLVLKACNNQGMNSNVPIIFHVLSKLIKTSQQIPDLAKSFMNTHIFKIYESLRNVPSSKSVYVLNCVEACLRIYPGSSGPSRSTIEKFLWQNLDQIDYEVVQSCGRCLHLLQQVKGGGAVGVNHKTQWKNYQLKLLGGIHTVYNKMFANCKEMYEENTEEQQILWETDQIEFNPEPVVKAAQMYIRCRNLICYLSIALREPFPVEKPILIKKILNIVIRGLSVNCLMLEQNPIADNVALSILLPELHIKMLNLLNVAITILKGQLRPYSDLILGILMDEMKWISAENVQTKYSSLRTKVYDTISLWCKIFNGGSHCETITEYLFQEILNDITPAQNEFTLKILSGARKHMSKKAKRQLQNAQNEKSNMSKTHAGNPHRKHYFSENRNQKLCIGGLCCLQEVISSVGNFLKPTLLKMMQTRIIQISAIFYELTQKPTDLYSNQNCRLEMYNVLYAILIKTHNLSPPPTELILSIILTAYERDSSLKVRIRCGFILKNLEKILHPQKESLMFTIEARDIRNTFIKMGHENLMRDFEINLSNSSCNGITVDDNEVFKLNISTNTSFPNFENDDIECDSQAHLTNVTIAKNHHKMESKLIAEASVSGIESLKDKVDNILEIESIQNKIDDIKPIARNPIITCNQNIEDFTKSSQFVLHVEDDLDIAIVNEEKSDAKNRKIFEPVTKKQKFHESNEIKNFDVISSDDEDNVLAEILSQFVDELG